MTLGEFQGLQSTKLFSKSSSHSHSLGLGGEAQGVEQLVRMKPANIDMIGCLDGDGDGDDWRHGVEVVVSDVARHLSDLRVQRQRLNSAIASWRPQP